MAFKENITGNDKQWPCDTAIAGNVIFAERLGKLIAHGRDADPELFEELLHPPPETQRLLDEFSRDLREAVAAFNDDTDRWLADVLPGIREVVDGTSETPSPTE